MHYRALADTMRKSAKRTVGDYIAARRSEFDKLEHSEKAIEVELRTEFLGRAHRFSAAGATRARLRSLI